MTTIYSDEEMENDRLWDKHRLSVANSNWCVVKDKRGFFEWVPHIAGIGIHCWWISWGCWCLAYSKDMMGKRK